jgi:Cu+-exporting ATPase
MATAFYWQQTNPENTWKAVTAVLLVACPCSLLLSATFTFGNLMRSLSRNRLYLKNANVIERIAETDTIVFDKTGTLTSAAAPQIRYIGKSLGPYEQQAIRHVAAQSNHPLSRALSDWEGWNTPLYDTAITSFQEFPGKGISATCNGMDIRFGRPDFVGDACPTILESTADGSAVHINVNGSYKGRFMITPSYREGVFDMMHQLAAKGMKLHVVSGDNTREEAFLKSKLGDSIQLQFKTSPEGKLEYIKSLQERGHKVMMIGDGLNDAGALQQSDAGIAITDNANCFTPACDAILDGQELHRMDELLQRTRAGKKVVAAGFILSILYNLVGMYFATQALLSPMIAAILMPASTMSIILLSHFGIRMQKR